jgi:hypothetical protein
MTADELARVLIMLVMEQGGTVEVSGVTALESERYTLQIDQVPDTDAWRLTVSPNDRSEP